MRGFHHAHLDWFIDEAIAVTADCRVPFRRGLLNLGCTVYTQEEVLSVSSKVVDVVQHKCNSDPLGALGFVCWYSNRFVEHGHCIALYCSLQLGSISSYQEFVLSGNDAVELIDCDNTDWKLNLSVREGILHRVFRHGERPERILFWWEVAVPVDEHTVRIGFARFRFYPSKLKVRLAREG